MKGCDIGVASHWENYLWIFPRSGNFCLHYRVQPGTGAHPASYPIGKRGCFPWGKAARTWSWPFTSI